MNPIASRRFQRSLNALLIVIVVVLAAWASTRYKVEFDWTYGNRNTLTAGSQRQLAAMPDKLQFLVFDYPGTEVRTEIEAWVARYQRFKTDVTLEFIDPSADPIRARDYNVTRPGEVVVEYQTRHESLPQLSETIISSVLQRLADAGERYVLVLQGHGERGIEVRPGQSQYDLTQLAETLTQKGIKVLPLNLLNTPKIPDNTSALVIGSPAQTLLEGEAAAIRTYVEGGGNLLWLADPDVPTGLDEVAKLLGIRWQDGTVIFANYAAIGSPSPAVFFATEYPPNAVTQEFRNLTAYPLARGIEFDTPATPKATGWTYVPIVQTEDDAWLESGKLDGEVKFDPPADLAGPLTIGLTMTRDVPGDDGAARRVQRVALFGDGDFMSDLMLGRYGNKQLATNVMQWLSSREAQINVEVPKAPDTSLYLPPWAFWLIGAGFTVIIPLLLLTVGVGRWLIRRRQ